VWVTNVWKAPAAYNFVVHGGSRFVPNVAMRLLDQPVRCHNPDGLQYNFKCIKDRRALAGSALWFRSRLQHGVVRTACSSFPHSSSLSYVAVMDFFCQSCLFTFNLSVR
jgi:hypothetical protein